MIDTPAGTTELPLVEASGDSCSCCALPEQAPPATVPEGAVVAEYGVDGMTCGNCVAHVSAELQAIAGVDEVRVELVAGGTSKVTVVSAEPIAVELVAEAVDEAGYALAR
ncbi:heavy-metal-associated domain-containing protein [Agromyces soli]